MWHFCWVKKCVCFSLQLTAEKKVDRRLLPPKKMLGKNSKSLVERRQKELELYLQTLLQQFPQATPTPLACFLHFHLYVSTPEATPALLLHMYSSLFRCFSLLALHLILQSSAYWYFSHNERILYITCAWYLLRFCKQQVHSMAKSMWTCEKSNHEH